MVELSTITGAPLGRVPSRVLPVPAPVRKFTLLTQLVITPAVPVAVALPVVPVGPVTVPTPTMELLEPELLVVKDVSGIYTA